MNFRLLGVDVEVQVTFWFTAVLLGMGVVLGSGASGQLQLLMMLVWVLVVFVSVLAHEFGHVLAFKRYRIPSDVVLYHFGGLTIPRAVLPLRRVDNIVVSLAGPFAGFFLAGVVYAFKHFAPAQADRLPTLVQFGLELLLYVNLYWGVFNLVPVLPLDGGHVLESALGPKRERWTARISMVAALAVCAYFLKSGAIFGTMMFGMLAFQSFRRLQSLSPEPTEDAPRSRVDAPPAEAPLTGELLSLLLRARAAVADEDLLKARSLAEEVIARQATEEPPPPRAIREALEVLGWVELIGGDPERAARMVREAGRHGEVDAALVGSLHFARKDLREARKVFEAARARGDERKEIVGPLIQILIEQGEIARAAAVAYDIVDALSEEDARRMAKIAFEGRAFDWSARLYEAVFERGSQPEDAYDAARAHAQDGAYERALELLRKAVEAGFSDRGRAWSDAALEALRADRALETVLPRP